jgi:hypothetical protein
MEVLEALPDDQAAIFERELRAQARTAKREVTNAPPYPPGVLERISGPSSSRWSHGAGGGRRRSTVEPHE